MVLANADLDALSNKMQIGLTPVIISEQVEWLSLDDWDAERNALNAEIERWRSDWESRDTDRYLTHYSKKFSTGRESYADWAQHKRQVNKAKSWIKLGLSNFSVFRNPGKEGIGGGGFRPGLPLQQSVQQNEEAPVLDQGRRQVAHNLRRCGIASALPVAEFAARR